MKRSEISLVVIAAVVALLSWQTAFAAILEENYQRTIPRQAATVLEVRNVNGRIRVSSWSADSIKIEAIKKVEAGSRKEAAAWLQKLEIEVVRQDKEIHLETIHPDRRGQRQRFFNTLRGKAIKWSVDYTISVPLDFDLKLGTTNGDIEASTLQGTVEAQSANGNVLIAELKGNVRGQTTNGKVRMNEIEGAVVARSTNGNVELSDIAGSVQASTTNGSVRADITSTELKKDCRLSTTNGNILVSLPGGISADIKAGTSNGRINAQLPVIVQGDISKRTLNGRINQGGPLLWLQTTNGNITIQERTVNPGEPEVK